MAHEALLQRIREMSEALRERAESNDAEDLLRRVETAMAQGEETAAALKATDSGFLHLPDGATARHQDEVARLTEERDALRNHLVALQQERDSLRHRVHELEDRFRESILTAASAPEASTSQPAEGDAMAAIEIEAFDPAGHKKRMGEILLDTGLLSPEQLQDLLAAQGDSRQKRLGALLVEQGIATEHMIAKILAAQLKLPYVDLDAVEIVEAAAMQITAEVARKYECIPIDGDLAQLTLAMANPMDLLAIENIEITSKRRVFPAVAIPSAIAAAIDRIYSAVS